MWWSNVLSDRESPVLIRALILPKVSTSSSPPPYLDIRVQNREASVLIRALILPEVSTTSSPLP